jgi:hypothetical protein
VHLDGVRDDDLVVDDALERQLDLPPRQHHGVPRVEPGREPALLDLRETRPGRRTDPARSEKRSS